MKRRFFLQFATGLLAAAPWLRGSIPTADFKPPTDISDTVKPLRVMLPGGWVYNSLTMDATEILRDWQSYHPTLICEEHDDVPRLSWE